jgi:plastocyanin
MYATAQERRLPHLRDGRARAPVEVLEPKGAERMKPKTVAVLAVLLLVVAGCSGAEDTAPEDQAAATPEVPRVTEAAPESEAPPSEAAAQETFTIVSGAAGEGDEDDVGVFDFYPSEVQVRPGDTLRFDNGSGAVPVPHTVTLGAGADIGASMPPPVAEGVGQVPAVWGQCVSDEALTPEDTSCPDGDAAFPPDGDTIDMEPFAAQGFYNSGIFDPGQSVVMPIAQDAAPGTHTFVCYLHPATMEMTVEVVDGDQPVQSQADLDAAAQEAITADLADGTEAVAAAEEADRPADTVQAGSEQGAAVVTRFFPTEISVPAGTTVTWVNEGNDPHVVAFGQEYGPHAPENFAPPTIPPGEDYTSGPAISGVFGNPPFPATTYALRFPDPGRYTYLCPIHPGMAGVVEVN